MERKKLINDKDISIVVQGNISEHTPICIKSLRNLFPCAEIILSTYEESDYIEYLCVVDKIVLSPDPGNSILSESQNTFNNINRQIVTTKAGIEKANNKYILKTRTDILFRSAEFINKFGKYDSVLPMNFMNRVIICNYYTRNPRVTMLCFHPSDWIIFGNSCDVIRLFHNTKCIEIGDLLYFKEGLKKGFLGDYLSRYTPEQYIYLKYLNGLRRLKFDSYLDYSTENVILTEKMLAYDFMILDYSRQIDICFLKYAPSVHGGKNTIISNWQWLALYSHYCQRRNLLWWIYLGYSFVFGDMKRMIHKSKECMEEKRF